MNGNALLKSISIGASVGTAAFMMFSAADKKKHSIKRNAGKMLKAAGNVFDEITSVMK